MSIQFLCPILIFFYVKLCELIINSINFILYIYKIQYIILYTVYIILYIVILYQSYHLQIFSPFGTLSFPFVSSFLCCAKAKAFKFNQEEGRNLN